MTLVPQEAGRVGTRPPEAWKFPLCLGSQAHRLSWPQMTNFYSSHVWMRSVWTFTNKLCSRRASSHVVPLFSVHASPGPGTESKRHSRAGQGPPRIPALTLLSCESRRNFKSRMKSVSKRPEFRSHFCGPLYVPCRARCWTCLDPCFLVGTMHQRQL